MQKRNNYKKHRPAQHQQKLPGMEWKMKPQPDFGIGEQIPDKKLLGKVALITGGDSGIGKAVALNYARNGCNVAIVYLNESKDAKQTKSIIESETDVECLLIKCDIQKEVNCKLAVSKTIKLFGRIDNECYNNFMCQNYEKYPYCYGNEGLRQYFESSTSINFDFCCA